MRPKERRDSGQNDLFRARLDQIIDLDHPLAKLGRAIDWRFLEGRFGAVYSDRAGHPPLPTRLMAGLSILKHMHNLSDEDLCARWIENPYYQLFCGEEFFRHKLTFDRSSLTRSRQRMGEERLVGADPGEPAVATRTGAAKPADFSRVIVDTTVQPKAVAFPTDAELMHRALRERLVRLQATGEPASTPTPACVLTRSATPPADLVSARLIRTLRSVAMGSYTHLSSDERDQIGIWCAAGRSVGAICQELGRAKSTISGSCGGTHCPRAGILRFTPTEPINCAGGVKRSSNARPPYVCFVRDRLAEGWTPEQISGWLKAGNEPRLGALGCETIYAFIYRAAQKAEALWRYLTRHHKRRRPRRARPARDRIKDRASIHDRPKAVENRGEVGHWEGDLIICKRTRPVLVLHERKSRVTLAARLMGKTAAETISVMLAVFARIDPCLRKSITFDNDTAFAQHGLLRAMRDMTTWFCDAYASWQKGGIENANGRLRRWLPRNLDIDRMSEEDIQEIVLTANLTPRKCLGFKTPFQAILAELGKDVKIRFA